MTKTNQKTPTAAIVFYVFAVIFLLIFAFNIYYSYDYLSKLGEQVSYSRDWSAVLSIYFGQCVPSLVGALATYGFGFVIVKLQTTQNVLLECIEDAVSDDEDEDFSKKSKIQEEKKKTEKPVEKKIEEKESKPVEEAKKKTTNKKSDTKKANNETVAKEKPKATKTEDVKEVVTEETKEAEKV